MELIFFLISFTLTSVFIIITLQIPKKRIGQVVRSDGPKKHLTKAGTPSMGGVLFILGTLITYIIYLVYTQETIPHNKHYVIMLIMPLLLYGSLGLLDDYLKIKEKSSKGLKPINKLFYQIIWASIFFLLFLDVEDTIIRFGSLEFNAHWLYGFFILLMFTSSTNAYNLSDGLDGLATGIGIIIFTGLLFIPKKQEIQAFLIIIIASLLAFLFFNFHPARIFMGDCGSMAIGGVLASIFIILKIEILLLVFGFVLILEALSVIIQVAYFKLTKGKRVFLMTPLHHHFELKGINEEKVVFIFWFITIISSIIGLILYNYYY